MQIVHVLRDLVHYSRLQTGYTLRPYQLDPAQAIVERIRDRCGDTLAVVFSRQSGKDEMLAQLVAYLLVLHSQHGGSIVVANPTQTPQAKVSHSRAIARLIDHPIARRLRPRADGMEIHVGRAKATYVGAMSGSARGQTASILLVANEAQDIDRDQWDAVFDPMAASTNAPTLFMGTVWDDQNLLARQMAHAETLQEETGRQCLWKVDWTVVEKSLPAYGDRVRARIKQHGASHPFIRTEYLLIPLTGDGGLFGQARQQLMAGTHPRRRQPFAGERIGLLLDVAGSDELMTAEPGRDRDPDSRRDSCVLTVVAIDSSGPELAYTVLDRVTWTNVPWPTVQGAVAALMDTWTPVCTIVDATGIGFGMAVALQQLRPKQRIERFTFSQKSKSDLGWRWLGIIDSGRFRHYAHDGADDTVEWWRQVGRVTYEVRPGPNRIMVWSVPDGDGHDDSVLSAALVAHLDELDPRPRVAQGH